MRFLIVGAGAIGGTMGGLLARSGADVTLVARGAHARALTAEGLTLARPTETLVLHLPVVQDVSALTLGADDVIVMATKSQDTAALLEQLATLAVGAGTAGELLPVICAQNGVANERMALRRFARVYGMVVLLPASQLEPGHVEASAAPYPGILDLGLALGGSDDVAVAVAESLSAAGFVCQPREDVMRWKHTKLLHNLSNAAEALCRPEGDDGNSPGLTQLQHLAMAEGAGILDAAGIDYVGTTEWDDYRGMRVQSVSIGGRERAGGSTWQSAARGTGRSETDFLNGEIVLMGRTLRLPTPVNSLMQTEANLLARSGRPPGSVAAGALLARIAAVPSA